MNKTREEAIKLEKGKANKLIRKRKREACVTKEYRKGENQRKATLTGLIREERVFQRKK